MYLLRTKLLIILAFLHKCIYTYIYKYIYRCIYSKRRLYKKAREYDAGIILVKYSPARGDILLISALISVALSWPSWDGTLAVSPTPGPPHI
jgi:hypothetical protein